MINQTIKPVTFGITGLGGYASVICRLLLEQSSLPNPFIQLTAVCEPALEAHTDTVDELRALGVTVVREWSRLLSGPIEAVWLPLPIPLHRPYTEQALAAGKAVMCEKPAAGSVQDLDSMRSARDAAGLPAAIGFQDIYKPSTLALKHAILDGHIGQIRSASLTACWPRDSRYYARSSWAGKQIQDGVWVMDSPASNALAHFLNLALFLLGETGQSVELDSIEAELYRVNPIENYDTCAFRILTRTGFPLHIYYTHACKETRQPRLVINGDYGKIIYRAGQDAVIDRKGGSESISLRDEAPANMVQRFAHLVRSIPDDRSVATLEIARAHLTAVNGASEATPIYDVPTGCIETHQNAEGDRVLAVSGIEDLFEYCAKEQRLPHETARAPWTAAAGSRSLIDYKVFSGPKP